MTERKIYRNSTIGQYVISLPLDWVRYIEAVNEKKLYDAQIRVTARSTPRDLADVSLSLIPQFECNRLTDPDSESHPITKREMIRRHKVGPSKGKLPNGGHVETHLEKVYHFKSGARLVVLPPRCIKWWMKLGGKRLHYLRVTAHNDRLVIEPSFRDLS